VMYLSMATFYPNKNGQATKPGRFKIKSRSN